MLQGMGRCMKVLVGVELSWMVFKGFGRCWKMLEAFGDFKKMLEVVVFS